VLESLSGYLSLASALLGRDPAPFCEAWNFGPRIEDSISVCALVERFIEHWGSGSWKDISNPHQPHEAHTLRLSIDKSETLLDWHPRWSVSEAIERTVAWYRCWRDQPTKLQKLCLRQIEDYAAE
jgi:CDP-glucose 4,6-dehydratase